MAAVPQGWFPIALPLASSATAGETTSVKTGEPFYEKQNTPQKSTLNTFATRQSILNHGGKKKTP
jgi:hypothetical protein